MGKLTLGKSEFAECEICRFHSFDDLATYKNFILLAGSKIMQMVSRIRKNAIVRQKSDKTNWKPLDHVVKPFCTSVMLAENKLECLLLTITCLIYEQNQCQPTEFFNYTTL